MLAFEYLVRTDEARILAPKGARSVNKGMVYTHLAQNLTLAFSYAKIFPSPNLRRGMPDRAG